MTRYIRPTAIGATSADAGLIDRNDCTVRALSNASGMEYAKAHALLADVGRVNGHGLRITAYHSVYLKAGFSAAFYGPKGRALRARLGMVGTDAKGMTIGKFCEKHPTGRHIIIIPGHALAVVNGQILDTGANKSLSNIQTVYTLRAE